MSGIKDKLRQPFVNRMRKRLKNKDMSVIASTCNGALILHDLGLKFNSPFVNLWIEASDFVDICEDLKSYMEMDLKFTKVEGISYPVGLLKNAKIYFMHYKSEEEAYEKWNERKKRINYDNIFILFAERDGCSEDILKRFDKLPFENKLVFVHKEMPEIKSAYYIKGFEGEDEIGLCSSFKGKCWPRKYYDQFDFPRWFNEGKF